MPSPLIPEVVSLSGNGKVLAISHFNDEDKRGHVEVFEFFNSSWKSISDVFYGCKDNVYFGNDISLSGDAGTIIISGDGDEKTGGCVQVYRYNKNGKWNRLGDSMHGSEGTHFGSSVSISTNGDIIGIGERKNEDGTVYVYKLIEGMWQEVGDCIYPPAAVEDFGISQQLSGNGKYLAIGGNSFSNSKAKGFSGIYERKGNKWFLIGNGVYGHPGEYFGTKIALSNCGKTLAVGAPCASELRGEVRAYNLIDNNLVSKGQVIIGEIGITNFGCSISMSFDGNTIAIGSSGSKLLKGEVQVYKYYDDKWNKINTNLEGSRFQEYLGVTVSLADNRDVIACGNYRKLTSIVVHNLEDKAVSTHAL